MKVFISHKKKDSLIAKHIWFELKLLDVDAYLDLLDDFLLDGKELTDHIKARLNECTDLLVVLSEETKESWWVPFEIGMASQKNYPIVNFLSESIKLPDYLSYWPRLKEYSDLKIYVQANREVTSKYSYYSAEERTKKFHDILKTKL